MSDLIDGTNSDDVHGRWGLPAWAADAVHTTVDIHLGWWDRVRILFGARLEVRTKTATEHEPGRAESETKLLVYFPRKFSGGVVEAAYEPTDK